METHKDLNVVTQRTLNPPLFISSVNHKEHLFIKRQCSSNLKLSPEKCESPRLTFAIDLKKVDRSHAQSEQPTKDIPRNYSTQPFPDKIIELKSRLNIPSDLGLKPGTLIKSHHSRPSHASNIPQPEPSPPKRLANSLKKSEDIWALLRPQKNPKIIIDKMRISIKVLKNEVNCLKDIRKDFDRLKEHNFKLIKLFSNRPLTAGSGKSEVSQNERLVIQYKVKIKQLEDTIKNILLEKATMQSKSIDDNYKILLYADKIRNSDEDTKKIKSEYESRLAQDKRQIEEKLRFLKQELYDRDKEIEKLSLETKSLSSKFQAEKQNLKSTKDELEYCNNENMKLMQNSINLIEEILELKKANQTLQNEISSVKDSARSPELSQVEKLSKENSKLKDLLDQYQNRLLEKEQNFNSLQRKWQKNKEKKNDLIEKWANLELDLNGLIQEKAQWEQKERMWMENEEMWERNEELWKIEINDWEGKQRVWENKLKDWECKQGEWDKSNALIGKLKENILLREAEWKKGQERLKRAEDDWRAREGEWREQESKLKQDLSGLAEVNERLNDEIGALRNRQRDWDGILKGWKKKEKDWNECQELWNENENEWNRERDKFQKKIEKLKEVREKLDNDRKVLESEKVKWEQAKEELEDKVLELQQNNKGQNEHSAYVAINEKDSEIQNLKSMIETLESGQKQQLLHFKAKQSKYKSKKSQFEAKEQAWKHEKLEFMYKESELISEINNIQFQKPSKEIDNSDLRVSLENKIKTILFQFQIFSEKVESKFQALTQKVENQFSSLIEIILSKKASSKNVEIKSLEDSIIFLSSLPPNSNPMNSGQALQALQESSVLPFHLLENHDFLLSNIQKLQITYPKLSKLVNLFTKLVESRSKPPKDFRIPNKIIYFSNVPTAYIEKILTVLKELEKPISTFAKLSNSPEISPISSEPPIKIEISYRLSESDDEQKSRDFEISKSEENYSKELELVIYNLKEKHAKDLDKIYLEIEERENLFNEEIIKLTIEIAELNKEINRLASENKVLRGKVKGSDQSLKEKNEEIEYLKNNERLYEQSLEGFQNKVKNMERKNDQADKASGTEQELGGDDPEIKCKILQGLYDQCNEHLNLLRSEHEEVLERNKALENENEELLNELKSFQFSNKN